MSARILVVDDIEANVRLLEAKLLAEYYDVITAVDGREAVQKAVDEAPDLILLDVMMPGMDGFEACQMIKADPQTAHIPIVMVTALSEVEDRVKGLDAGADDFLTKPVDDMALFARIRSLVRLKRASDEWRTREETSSQFGVTPGTGIPDAIDVGTSRVLVVRDASGVPDTVIGRMQDIGYDVASAEDQAEALHMATNQNFDTVVVNDWMPSGDILRLCSQLRSDERSRALPIVMVIAEGETERLTKALELGVTDYIVRPIDRDELHARIRTQVRRKRYDDELRQNYERSLTAALTDPLTGLNNRRYLEAHFVAVDKMLADANKPVSLMIIDIDRFKAVNDRFGHGVGDEVIKAVAQRIQNDLRSFDTAIRYGGEEFVVLMPNTLIAAAHAAAERLCEEVGETPIHASAPAGVIPVTVSVGVATEIAGQISLGELVQRADEALLQAKRDGRNRVVVAGGANPPPPQRAVAGI